ncbi:ABC transporter substrate-binding protein [Lederbergia sp. NSJ-179]|uniref:ABC transporter substrate-binding protein n=1 Tax=Lederbergia sp. NSJ-179 TaxID=2931402 RepID=UPI001FD37FB9|nr:ABC transporter substrate-binding protein [Lederbergia sp. NSJ-179]MCJ7840454.1 ABC transporter substrate-binding protein [Lederbergia sp. NSJ-179]
MNSSWKKIAMLALLIGFVLTGCGQTSSTPDTSGGKADQGEEKNENAKKTYKIGVTQYVEHPSLNAAYDGFKKAMDDSGLNVKYVEKNANGDSGTNTTIASDLINSDVDLIFANATPSAQAVASATKDIPIVFTSVTDAVGAELVESNENPGGNVTGTVDMHPDAITNTITFLAEELGMKKVGMVYNAGEQNSRAQVDIAKKAAKELDSDIGIEEVTVATSADVKQATESLIGKVDSLYIITDNTVVSALESVITVANENKLPLMVGEIDSVRRGGLAAYGFEYTDIGYEAGEMAIKILKGEAEPGELPVQYPPNLKLVVNQETAETIGLDIKDEWKAELE